MGILLSCLNQPTTHSAEAQKDLATTSTVYEKSWAFFPN